MMAEKITFDEKAPIEDFWEYLERFYQHLANKYGMQDAKILIPKILKETFLEKCPDGTIALDGHKIPIYTSERIMVEESAQSDVLATEVWVAGLW